MLFAAVSAWSSNGGPSRPRLAAMSFRASESRWPARISGTASGSSPGRTGRYSFDCYAELTLWRIGSRHLQLKFVWLRGAGDPGKHCHAASSADAIRVLDRLAASVAQRCFQSGIRGANGENNVASGSRIQLPLFDFGG